MLPIIMAQKTIIIANSMAFFRINPSTFFMGYTRFGDKTQYSPLWSFLRE